MGPSTARWLLLVLALSAPVAVARVGSGQHYSAPSRSSSGGSRSGGGHATTSFGGSRSSSWSGTSGSGVGGSDVGLVFFLVSHPLFSLALLVCAVLLWRAFVRGFGSLAATQRALATSDDRPDAPPSGRQVSAWVDALRAADPGFDLVPFLDRTRALFLRVQEAWSTGTLTAVRRDLSDATWLRLRVQLRLLAAQGVRNVTADMAVTGLELVGLERSSAFDTLHVRIRAQARDVDVPADTEASAGVAAARRAALEPFVEVWSFVRRPGTRTASGAAADPGTCPNCGAPYDGGAAANCAYCGAVVNSGAYDWVLAEITQGVEANAAPTSVPGLEALHAADPAFSLEVLEDRASLLFWRWIEAQSMADAGRLAKVAAPALMGALREDLASLASRGRRRVFQQCAVGSVAVRTVADAGGTTEADVEVRWSARLAVVSADERGGALPVLPQRWIFTLARRSGVRTDAVRGMATARCGNCGAPLTDGLDPRCDHCGQPLDDGAHDWVLLRAETFERWSARERAAPPDAATATGPAPAKPPGRDVVLDAAERRRLLALMAAMAASDGTVDERERRMLRLCAERWGVPEDDVERALAADPVAFEGLLPAPGPGGESFLRSLVQIALVDGKVDRDERRMLETAAARLGMSRRLPELLARFGLG